MASSRPPAQPEVTNTSGGLREANSSSLKLFFSVGEPSGDLHAANLIRCLKSRLDGNLSLRGFGGKKMSQNGCQLDFELTNLAVMGFVEVLPKLREFFRVADIASEIFESSPPDGVVLVDFPGFNWHIAKRAKQHGIPVFYYLPPQLWAWGSWRFKKMQRNVDHVLCNLPFEESWYRERDMPVDYVGHPFFDEVAERVLNQEFLSTWKDHDGVQVAVLPGSRSKEVKNIWPMQLAAIRELAERHRSARFLVACLKEEHRQQCQSLLNSTDSDLNIHFFTERTSEIIEIADCALMKSGSVSLEMMARGTPAVVIYHVGRAFYTIGKRLTNLSTFTLPNLIAEKTVMPEFLAVGSSRKDAIQRTVAAMDRLLVDRDERALRRTELLGLSQSFGKQGASVRAADIILSRLGADARTGSRQVRAA